MFKLEKKCECYHEYKQKHYYTDFEKGVLSTKGIYEDYTIRTVGVCWGTKECEECTCGGDENKCDFYKKEK